MIKKIFILLIFHSCLCDAADFEKSADKYIEATHSTARDMAKAVFVNNLVSSFILSYKLSSLNNAELVDIQGRLHSKISNVVREINNDDDTLIWDSKENRQILHGLRDLRSELGAAIAHYRAGIVNSHNTGITLQHALGASFRTMINQCEIGVAVFPATAGQSMPSLLKNSFNIQISYTYSIESKNGQVGAGYSPEAPRGSAEVNAALYTGMTYAAYVGGPVGWAVAAGLASAQYIFNAEEKRKADMEMSNAFLKTLDRQATSEDVRQYHKDVCAQYLPILRDIHKFISAGDTRSLEAMGSLLRDRQSVNLKKYDQLRSCEKCEKELGVMFNNLPLNDLVDLTLLSAVEASVSTSDQMLKISSMDDSGYFDDLLSEVEKKILLLQGISYQLSLVEQDQNILSRLRENSQISAQEHQLILEWNDLFSKLMVYSFRLSDIGIKRIDSTIWEAKYFAFKKQFPNLKSTVLDKHYSLLKKVNEVLNEK